MAIVSAVAIVSGIFDTQEFETLVVFLATSRHRGEFIAATTIEGRCRTPFFARAPAPSAATTAASIARTT
jgi:hypothetical protein